ncbi:WD40-repeat-containing domain protein [Cunninghamella echinulata]|nr:WD40-repeat-containing domain protein [Cunninghamella echinulata]
MDCYLGVDDLSPPATPPSSSTSSSSTTSNRQLYKDHHQQQPLIQDDKNKTNSDYLALMIPTLLNSSRLDFITMIKKTFRQLDTTQKQLFLTEIIGVCDNTLLTFINTLVAPKLKVDFLKYLPTEISLHIISFIKDPYTLAQASRVSTIWHSILLDDSIWKTMCIQHNYQSFNNDSIIPSSSLSTNLLPSHPKYIPSSSTFKNLFQRKYQIDMAWINGGAKVTSCTNDIGSNLVTSLQMDDEFIVIGCDDNRIVVFDASSGNYLRTLHGHSGGVWALQFIKHQSQTILVSGGCDRDARVWNLKTGQLYHTLQGHSSTIRCLQLPDHKTAVTGSRDASLRIWDIEKGILKHLCLGHHSSVRCLDIQGNQVVSGSYDSTARLWNINTGECMFVCRGHLSQIYAVAIDDKYIVTGSLDSTIKVWSIAQQGTCIATLHGHTTLVGHLQLLPNLLVSGGSDGCLRFWDLTTYECKNRISAHDNSVTCLRVDGKHVLSGGSDGSVKLWDLDSGQLIRTFTQVGRTVWKLECHATKAVVVLQRRLHRDREAAFQTAIELHDFDYQH